MIRPPKSLPSNLREWSQYFRDTTVVAETLADILPTNLGGTGASDIAGARTNLLVPSRTGDGASGSWSISVTGTSSNVTGVVAVANGGTGAITATAALVALGASERFSGSFTATLTGCTTSPTGTVYYSRSGGVVTLTIPQINGTSNSTAATLTGLPTTVRPVRDQVVPLRLQDNTAVNGGYARVDSSGVVTLYLGVTLGGFTAAGTKGVELSTVTYGVD